MKSIAEVTVQLRVADPSDALCIAVLGTQVFLDTYATAGIRSSLAQEVLENFSPSLIAAQIADPSIVFVVAEASGHLVGFAQMTFGATHDFVAADATAELNRLYVQERFSGRGIGKALLNRVEELAASSGASTLWLTAWVENRRALAFYAGREYRDVGATIYAFQEDRYENRVFVKALHLNHDTVLFIVQPGPRPAYSLVAEHLWGVGVDFDSDANSVRPDDTSWTELTIQRRPDYVERVDIDPVSEDPLVLRINSSSATLTDRVAHYLAGYCSATLVDHWPPTS